jgi:hypothetical protein
MFQNDGPLALFAKYGSHLVTLSLADDHKYESFPIILQLTLLEAVVAAQGERDKTVGIVIHTDKGDYTLSPEQVAALLV